MQGPYSGSIDWQEIGKPDYLLGTGATRSEKLLTYGVALAASAVVLALNFSRQLGWTWWQILLALALTLDTTGGVVANSLNSAKRTYHSAVRAGASLTERVLKNHMIFVALHIQPFIVGLVFGGGWLHGFLWYGALLLSAVMVLTSPLYLKRPLAMALCLASVFLALYVSPTAPGFEWLGPALFLKLIYGHLVPEEPYRPLPSV